MARRRILGIGLPAVEPARQFLAELEFFQRVRGVDHALGQRAEFVAAKHSLRVQTIGKLNDLRLLSRGQTLDFIDDLCRAHAGKISAESAFAQASKSERKVGSVAHFHCPDAQWDGPNTMQILRARAVSAGGACPQWIAR